LRFADALAGVGIGRGEAIEGFEGDEGPAGAGDA
jgi:hypothetical protein